MVVFKATMLAIFFLIINTTRYCSTMIRDSKGKEPPKDVIPESSSAREQGKEISDVYLDDDDSFYSSDDLPELSEEKLAEPMTKVLKINKCEELLKEEYLSGPTNGLKNYKESYKNTSISEIRTKFKIVELLPDGSNSVLDQNSRLVLLKYYLSNNYFACLNENNGINEENVKLPLDFCKEEAKNVHAKLNEDGKEFTYEQIFESCKTYVTKLFSSDNLEIIKSKKAIIDVLYSSWSYNKLKYETFISLNDDISNSKETEEMKRTLVTSFPSAYFELIGELVENLQEGQGNFKSVEVFCGEKGEEIIDFIEVPKLN